MISFNQDLSNSIVAKETAMMWNSIFWRTMTSPTLSPSAFGLQELWNEDECSKFQRPSRTMFDIESSVIVPPRIVLNGLKRITCRSEPISVPIHVGRRVFSSEISHNLWISAFVKYSPFGFKSGAPRSISILHVTQSFSTIIIFSLPREIMTSSWTRCGASVPRSWPG